MTGVSGSDIFSRHLNGLAFVLKVFKKASA